MKRSYLLLNRAIDFATDEEANEVIAARAKCLTDWKKYLPALQDINYLISSSSQSNPSIELDPIRTVIAVNVSSVNCSTDPDYGASRPPSISNSSGGGGGQGNFNPKTLINRTVSNRSSVINYVKPQTHGKKLGHRREVDGEVTYKKFETTQLIGSIQLGLQYVLENEANVPDRDLLIPVSLFSRYRSNLIFDCLRFHILVKISHNNVFICQTSEGSTASKKYFVLFYAKIN